MMLPTHALVGLALAAPVARLFPEFGAALLAGAFVGSVLPDLDMYAGHRKTLHYPTLYPLFGIASVAVALLWTTTLTVVAAAVLVGAAVHCRMDILGGGLELRPWEGTSERAVYDHASGEWLPPRRWIAYDGSPGDLAVAVAVGVPLVVGLDGSFGALAGVALAVGAAYALLRRRLANLAPAVFGRTPDPIVEYIPERYLEE